MEPTDLIYLGAMAEREFDARVVAVEEREAGHTAVALDRTLFYPQGGGQPCDRGTISCHGRDLSVESVRFEDGLVWHMGPFASEAVAVGDDVHGTIDDARRVLNSRLHSAGHLIDMAIAHLGLDWPPTKAYHFPDSPYVEYAGVVPPEERPELVQRIEREAKSIEEQDLIVRCRLVERGELEELCHHVPENIPENKPTRVVEFGDFAIPCGGTHVGHLLELGDVTVTKLKQKGELARVGYDVSRDDARG